MLYKVVVTLQTRIHTGFHRFTKIGQIFHNKYFLIKKKALFKLKFGQYPVWMTLRPRKGHLKELKSKKIPGRACPRSTLDSGLDPRLLFSLWMKFSVVLPLKWTRNLLSSFFFFTLLLFIWYGVITFKSAHVILYFAIQMKAKQCFPLSSCLSSPRCD